MHTYIIILISVLFCYFEGYAQFIEVKPQFNITNHQGDDLAPKWSLNGKQLVFQSNRNGNWDIYIYHLLTDSLEQVTNGTFNEKNPVWFDNGESIVFDSDANRKRQLFKMNLRSGETQLLFDKPIESKQASFNSSEEFVYFSGFDPIDKSWEIYSYEIDYKTLTKLTNLDNNSHSLTISPDEDHIVFTSSNGEYPFHQLKKMNWYGENLELLLPENSYDPSWDAVGVKIYFVSEKEIGSSNIHSIWHNGKHREQITVGRMKLKHPSVSPDSKFMIVCGEKDTGYDLFIIPIEDY